MKVLLVCQYYYPENFVITKIAEQMVRDGLEVHVLTGRPNYGYGYILPAYKNISEEIINGVNIHRVNLYPRKKSRLSIIRNYLSFWKNSKKWVRKTKIDFDFVSLYNVYKIDGKVVSRGDAMRHAQNVLGKHVTDSDWKDPSWV